MKMSSSKSRKIKKTHSKKDKQLIKLINNSDSESECSEHELSHYLNDRVKLMKEVLKIIKPKKIKTMAPDCIKNLDNEEINSMLLEELLGISNKRLKCIFNGQQLEEDSSSTDPEEEQQPIDLISLDDISDDEFVIDLDSDAPSNNKKGHKKHSKTKIKEEPKRKKIKKEKQDKSLKDKTSKRSKEAEKDKTGQENLMSVLELLELQARARAIRSQLAIENSKKAQEKEKSMKVEESDYEDAVIIDSPKHIEIVITSSESETEDTRKDNSICDNPDDTEQMDKEDCNKESNSRMKDSSNQHVTEGTDKNEETVDPNSNLDSDSTVENPTGQSEKNGINDKVDETQEETSNVSEDTRIESTNQTNLSNEQNTLDKAIENSDEALPEKEESIKKHPETVKVDENYFEKENPAINELNNTNEEVLTKSSWCVQDVFVVDSGSENDIIDKSTRRKSHKSRKCKTKKLNANDCSNDVEKSRTKNRREGCKHKAKNVEAEVRGASKNENKIKIKSETKDAKSGVKFEKSMSWKSNKSDEGDGIVINMDPSEIECIISD